MTDIGQTLWAGITTASWLDQLNLALGLFGVGLMIRRSLWAFPVGLAAVTVQGVLFYRASFPADALLQVFFFGTLAWGWRHWVRDSTPAAELPVTALSWTARCVVLGATVLATVVWAKWIGPAMGAVMPWRDAFIAMFSVAAQVLQARKNVENWPLWAVVNLAAVASYWSAALAYTACLYAIFFIMGLVGWRAWARAMSKAAGA